jgi:uncharacterized protein YecT (DUF1311 family)
MKTCVFAVLMVAAAACVQGVAETKAGRIAIQGEGVNDGLLSQAVLAWAPFERIIRRAPEPRLTSWHSTPGAYAVRGMTPHAPTEKDLADCMAVMDREGHGPDPGSEEWWAACDRLRARRGAPSFDCSKASGPVEALICSDPELAALDVELARLYQAVSAKMSGRERKTLRTYQRGWLKGRNDCWKAVGVGVRACVEASYRGRIQELRAQF